MKKSLVGGSAKNPQTERVARLLKGCFAPREGAGGAYGADCMISPGIYVKNGTPLCGVPDEGPGRVVIHLREKWHSYPAPGGLLPSPTGTGLLFCGGMAGFRGSEPPAPAYGARLTQHGRLGGRGQCRAHVTATAPAAWFAAPVGAECRPGRPGSYLYSTAARSAGTRTHYGGQVGAPHGMPEVGGRPHNLVRAASQPKPPMQMRVPLAEAGSACGLPGNTPDGGSREPPGNTRPRLMRRRL